MTGSSVTNRNGETEKDLVGSGPGMRWARTRAERVNDRATQAIVAGVDLRGCVGGSAFFRCFPPSSIQSTLVLLQTAT